MSGLNAQGGIAALASGNPAPHQRCQPRQRQCATQVALVFVAPTQGRAGTVTAT